VSQSDPFALKNSGLNDILFAEIGSGVNGSPLTILSMLARLGEDPWTEAARLAGQVQSGRIRASLPVAKSALPAWVPLADDGVSNHNSGVLIIG
jgi:cell wall assembly regulator SMI1